MSGEYVTLVNRTQKTVEGCWDSRIYQFAPGKHEVEKAKAIKFVDQNPVMGSEDPRTGNMIYKLGIEELYMDCSQLSTEFLSRFASEKWQTGEKWDRTKLTGARPSEIVPGDNGIYSGRDVAAALPLSSTFVDNR